jgi:hypothetical protein
MIKFIVSYMIITFFFAALFTVSNFDKFEGDLDARNVCRHVYKNWIAGHKFVFEAIRLFIAK